MNMNMNVEKEQHMNSFDHFLQRIGGLTCGRLLIWSVAANVVMFTLLTLTFIHYPVTGEDVPAKAARLQELRNLNH